MPGNLYRFEIADLEPRFCEVRDNNIQSHKYWNEQILVAKGDVVLFLERFDLTPKTAGPGAALTTAALAAAATALRPAAVEAAKVDWKEALRLWNEKEKRIPGSIFLHPNGKLVWISDIDLKYFEKVENK